MALIGLAGSDSDQLRVDWIKRQLDLIPSGLTILDAGAGEQRFKPLCSHLKYISQDFCQYEGEGDGKALQTGSWDVSKIDIVSNIIDIPLNDASVDVILCTEVIEHIPDPVLAIKEFSRLLKPGGTLLLTAPFCSLTHFAPYHYSTGFNKYWYEEHLTNSGFDIDEMKPLGNWFEFIAQEMSRARLITNIYSSKILSWVMLLASYPLRFILNILSNMDKGSEEVLCYSYLVKAKKKS